MAIDTRESISAEYSGDARPPRTPVRRRPGWLGPHAGRALVGAVGGYALGHWIGNLLAAGYPHVQGSGQNDIAIVLGLSIGVIGWLAGAGMLDYPLAKIAGREPLPPTPSKSWTRYFGPALDHKVIGLQYTIVVLLFLFTGGLLAMAIRTELLNPTSHTFGPGTYISVVSEHGTIMMMMASSIVIDPVGSGWPSRASSRSPCGSSPPDTWSSWLPCRSAASRRGGPATPPSRRRRQGAWTPIWWASPSSASA
jgi:hypothetical protein